MKSHQRGGALRDGVFLSVTETELLAVIDWSTGCLLVPSCLPGNAFNCRLYLFRPRIALKGLDTVDRGRLFSQITSTQTGCSHLACRADVEVGISKVVVWDGVTCLKVRPHRTRSAAADCGLCPLRNVTF